MSVITENKEMITTIYNDMIKNSPTQIKRAITDLFVIARDVVEKNPNMVLDSEWDDDTFMRVLRCTRHQHLTICDEHRDMMFDALAQYGKIICREHGIDVDYNSELWGEKTLYLLTQELLDEHGVGLLFKVHLSLLQMAAMSLSEQ
jgi:hypothetical protein